MRAFISEKGFTLFTALLSIVLISLAWTLISSMTSSEKNTASTIDDIRQHDEMQSIIDLQRADAMQVFNFNLRLKTEEYWTELDKEGIPRNMFYMDSSMDTWRKVYTSFSRNHFASDAADDTVIAFADLTAAHLSNIIERSTDVRGYPIDLANYALECPPNGGNCVMTTADEAKFRTIMQDMYTKQDEDKFIEKISCDSGVYTECLGPYYINMDLSSAILSDETYQKLPKIKITHRRSGRTLIEPILPRGVFRIYMPTRMFKALAGAYTIKNSLWGITTAPEACSDEDSCKTAKDNVKRNLKNAIIAAADAVAGIEDADCASETGGKFCLERGTFNEPFVKIDPGADIVKGADCNPASDPPVYTNCSVKAVDYRAYLVYRETDPNYMVYSGDPALKKYGIIISGAI